ncbi:AAA family ATPase [Paracoccus sp. Z330]|uniref:AAA family ATPase n=2 Tax=Paracoccus onchidii TaxID=3017813 RepID=A0ABT4ZIZ9_9RHOB|nr:AAA family ATPase [Paracoccus onchidii]MDB6179179.1 AAA family ATPase [Paracoccus onchidii]
MIVGACLAHHKYDPALTVHLRASNLNQSRALFTRLACRTRTISLRITNVAAKNFRTLQDFSIDFNHNYCAISGRNNCGKSSILRIIQHFLVKGSDDPFFMFDEGEIDFASDKTKWVSNNDDGIEVSISIEVLEHEDSEVFFVIKSYIGDKAAGSAYTLKFTHQFIDEATTNLVCQINDKTVADRIGSEILKKIRSTNSIIFHNSVMPGRSFYFGGQRVLEVVEAHFSAEDRSKISSAQTTLQRRIKAATKQHKSEIDKLLGRLKDKYQVELATVDRGKPSSYSLEVKLLDKSVDVPLKDWGAGTQNRTRLLMTLLEAIRKKSHTDDQERLTPVLLVEEPESFLHPSAQSDFGQVLAGLADEHDIQIIATTHSPYLLNMKEPLANTLLDRKTFRGALKETVRVSTDGEKWMLPFSKILGVVPEEFQEWSQIFSAGTGQVVLVEGDIDVEYFAYFKDKHADIYKIGEDVEILPYNGKDALKNTQILKFMIGRMERAFITFDLDAKGEVQKKLEALELVEGRDFCAIGEDSPGGRCIEGLLPKSIKSKVYADNADLVQAMGSVVSKEKNDARNDLKAKLLEATKSSGLLSKDFPHFKKLFDQIHKGLFSVDA